MVKLENYSILTRFITYDYHHEYNQTSWSPDIIFLSLFHNNTVHCIDQHGSFDISGSSSTNFRFVTFKKPIECTFSMWGYATN